MRHGAEGAGKGKHLGKPLEGFEAQAATMLTAFKDAHHNPDIDPAHIDHNDPAILDAAAEEWTGDPDDKDSLAARYRKFADEHPEEHVGLNNRKKLRELIAALTGEDKKLH